VWLLEWLLFFGGLDVRQVPSERPFILIAKIILNSSIHNVVNGAGLWQIREFNTYFWKDKAAGTTEVRSPARSAISYNWFNDALLLFSPGN
jgi:hypothetical protein